jgi:hypothetical protein
MLGARRVHGGIWLQTTGAALLVVKWCCPVRVGLRAQESPCTYGLLYLAAVRDDRRRQEQCQGFGRFFRNRVRSFSIASLKYPCGMGTVFKDGSCATSRGSMRSGLNSNPLAVTGTTFRR